MAERRRTEAVDEAEVLAHVEAAADELYALAPDEFSSARDDLVRQAREQRNQPLARELGKLRRPTLSAWLINLLWRDQREVMEQLFALSQEMGRAQAEAAGPEMRSLMTQRRQVEQALLRQAKALARERGVDVTDSVEREAQETLGAALAQPAVAEEVRTGRLVKSASYAGFGGGAPATPAAAAPRPAPAPAAREPADIQAAQRARERREAAERRVAEAREAVDAAAAALTTKSVPWPSPSASNSNANHRWTRSKRSCATSKRRSPRPGMS